MTEKQVLWGYQHLDHIILDPDCPDNIRITSNVKSIREFTISSDAPLTHDQIVTILYKLEDALSQIAKEQTK